MNRIVTNVAAALGAVVIAGLILYHPVVRVIALAALLVAGSVWLVRRHPLIAVVLVGFLRGLLGRRR